MSNKEIISKTFKEWEEERLKWKKEHPIQNYIKYNIYYPLYRFITNTLNPINWFKEVKWFIQRGYRGWAECDVWSYYSYNIKVNLEALKWLKKYKHGIPNIALPDITEQRNYTEEEFEQGVKNWNEILDKMIYAFEMLKKSEYEGTAERFFASSENPDKHFLADTDFSKKYPEHYLMSKEEDDKINEGLDLFRKHYFDLWD